MKTATIILNAIILLLAIATQVIAKTPNSCPNNPEPDYGSRWHLFTDSEHHTWCRLDPEGPPAIVIDRNGGAEKPLPTEQQLAPAKTGQPNTLPDTAL